MKNWQQKVSLMGFFLALPVLLALSGCAERRTDVTYILPNWTPEGLIYAQKIEESVVKYAFSTAIEGTKISHVTMDENGDNEKTLPYTRYPYFSPKGTYALTIDKTSTFHIFKRNNDVNPVEQFTWQPTTEAIQSLDWGPEEDRVVWVAEKSKILQITDINGVNVKSLATPAWNVAWKYGARIIYDASFKANPSAGAASVLSDGSLLVSYSNVQGGDFNISKVSTDEVIYFGQKGIEKARFSAPMATPEVVSDNKNLWNIRLSPNAQKVVASGPNIDAAQIWLINIDGTGLKRIK